MSVYSVEYYIKNFCPGDLEELQKSGDEQAVREYLDYLKELNAHDRERQREYNINYYNRHPERKIKYARRWNHENPERRKEINRRYYQNRKRKLNQT